MTAKKIDALVGQLAGPNGRIRARAAKRLIALGDRRAAPPIIALLGHENKHVRVRAAEVLGELGETSAFMPLRELLAEPDYEVHSAAVLALGALGDLRALPILVAELGHEEQGLQSWTAPDGSTQIYTAKFAAAAALARLGSKEATTSLLPMLHSKHLQMRLEVVRTLGKLGGDAVFAQLTEMLADEERTVASTAAATLYEINPSRALTTLRIAIGDSRANVRRTATEMLTRLGDQAAASIWVGGGYAGATVDKPSAESGGRAGADDLDRLAAELQSSSATVRLAAVGEIGRRGGVEAEHLLRAASDDSDYSVRSAARLMLAQMNAAQDVSTVIAGLNEALGRLNLFAGDRPAVRVLLSGVAGPSVAVGGDSDTQLLAELQRELGSADVQGRITAAIGLARLGRAETVAALTVALGDEVAAVRRAVVAALAKFNETEVSASLATQLRREGDAGVRAEIVKALSTRDGTEVQAAVRAALNDPANMVRLAAARVLVQQGDSSAIPILTELLGSGVDDDGPINLSADARQTLMRLLTEGNATQRLGVVLMLRKVTDAVMADALAQVIDDADANVRQQATYALAEQGDLRAMPVLLAELKDAHPEIREFAASYLGVLGSEAAMLPLREALDGESADVRAAAAGALGEIGGAAALPQLMAMRRDDAVTSSGDTVAEAVREAIGQIRKRQKGR